jgi:predicted ribosomally synthesized peptide with nif11-like leader
MSENARKFEKDLQDSEELRNKFEAELKRIAEAQEAQSDAEAITNAAKALGYDISIPDIEKTMAESSELDQDELESVSGGAGVHWCVSDYACYLAYEHDTENTNTEEACYKDYKCFFVYHDGGFSCKYTGYKKA